MHLINMLSLKLDPGGKTILGCCCAELSSICYHDADLRAKEGAGGGYKGLAPKFPPRRQGSEDERKWEF